MTTHILFRRCDCKREMFVIVDHKQKEIRSEGCYLCHKGDLRFKFKFPKNGDLLIGGGRSFTMDYVNTVVCGGCFKDRRIGTFKEQV